MLSGFSKAPLSRLLAFYGTSSPTPPGPCIHNISPVHRFPLPLPLLPLLLSSSVALCCSVSSLLSALPFVFFFFTTPIELGAFLLFAFRQRFTSASLPTQRPCSPTVEHYNYRRLL